MGKKKKREIHVSSAPGENGSRKAASSLAEKSLEEERLEVLRFSKAVGAKFSFMLLAVGAFLLLLSVFATFTVSNVPRALYLGFLIFLGALNVIGGLLLIAVSN